MTQKEIREIKELLSAFPSRNADNVCIDENSDAFSELKLAIKYILFDLEATKRENGYLRRMLSEGDAG